MNSISIGILDIIVIAVAVVFLSLVVAAWLNRKGDLSAMFPPPLGYETEEEVLEETMASCDTLASRIINADTDELFNIALHCDDLTEKESVLFLARIGELNPDYAPDEWDVIFDAAAHGSELKMYAGERADQATG